MINDATIGKEAALTTKIAAMSAAELEARVQQVYALPDSEMTPEVIDELGEIMVGTRP